MPSLKTEDTRAGLMFLSIGLTFGLNTLGGGYRLSQGDGRGLFPISLCVILLVLGSAILWKAQSDAEPHKQINWRAVVFIASAPIAFGLGCTPAPFLLGFILGPMLEEHFRRAMLISEGNAMVFLTRPISAVLIGIAVVLAAMLFIPSLFNLREEVFHDVDD